MSVYFFSLVPLNQIKLSRVIPNEATRSEESVYFKDCELIKLLI